MISGPAEEIGQPSARIDVIEPGGDNQRIQRSGPLDVPVTAGEQLRAATQGDAAQGALHGIVGQAGPPVNQEPAENSPSLRHVVHCLGGLGATQELVPLPPHPSLQIADQPCSLVLAHQQAPLCRQTDDIGFDIEDGNKPPLPILTPTPATLNIGDDLHSDQRTEILEHLHPDRK